MSSMFRCYVTMYAIRILCWTSLTWLIQDDISIEEHPTQIIGRKEQVLRDKLIPLVKVLWFHHKGKDITWVREDKIKELYLDFFLDENKNLNFGDEIFSWEEECNISKKK